MKTNLVILLFLNFLCAFSQDKVHEKLPLLQEEVEKLNGRIISLLQKKQIVKAEEEVSFLHVYCFYADVSPGNIISKEELLNLNIENNLRTSYSQFGRSKKKKNKYITTLQSFVYNPNNKKPIASGDASLMGTYRKNLPDKVGIYEILTDVSLEYRNSVFFVISSWPPIYCMTKENKLFVIFENKSRDWEMIPIEEFVEKYYDKMTVFGFFL